MKKNEQLAAFRQVRIAIADKESDVWRDDVVHVEGMHEEAWQAILDELDALQNTKRAGHIVLCGRPGVGKTHFLGSLRRRVGERRNLFAYAQLSDPQSVWRSLSYTLARGLGRDMGGKSQASAITDALCAKLRVGAPSGQAGSAEDLAAIFETARGALRKRLRSVMRGQSDVRTVVDLATAIFMLSSEDPEAQEIGEEYINRGCVNPDFLSEYAEPLADLGRRLQPRPDRDRVIALAALAAAADKRLVIAIDQLDGMIQIQRAGGADQILHALANSLMECAEALPNALIVLSCLEESWDYICGNAVASAADRFPNFLRLRSLPSSDLAERLVAAYLTPGYEKAGFTPPWPTWPVAREFFANAREYSSREILRKVDRHIKACLRDGIVRELTSLGGPKDENPPPVLPIFDKFDAQFAALKKAENPAKALDTRHVDTAMAGPMLAGLRAWVIENQAPDGRFGVRGESGPKPALHGRLNELVDARTDQENRWSFRVIAHTARGGAMLSRLENAAQESGFNLGAESRRLIVLRPEGVEWTGAKTLAALAAFENRGGRLLTLPPDEVAVFQALEKMLTEHGDALDGWLRARRPASETVVLRDALASVKRDPIVHAPVEKDETEDLATPTMPDDDRTRPNSPGSNQLRLGGSESGAPVGVPLEMLRRHMVIFGGSGSGKTVLLRRIVEECALQGVSSIVLDPNNDLARLGEQWPDPPASWTGEDAQKARRYRDAVDVTVWTPGARSGRPISFQPLAGLKRLMGNRDEFEMVLSSIVGELAPRAGLPRSGGKEAQGRAILREALAAYARGDRQDLKGFLDFLADLPEDVCALSSAASLAPAMANSLRAARINDPLFGGDGANMDPGVLLTPPPGKSARVSVINLAWLPDEIQRQGFVAQLQRALFSWIKANPAGDRPLGGLLVMDEARIFAPSGGDAPSLHTTRILAAQARKYGLGLVIATQAPKDLHNTIPGNAATQIYGRLTAPAQFRAAEEIARQAGAANPPDFGRLTVGNFFLISDGLAPQQIVTPQCLSWHPSSPPSASEVMEMVREEVAA